MSYKPKTSHIVTFIGIVVVLILVYFNWDTIKGWFSSSTTNTQSNASHPSGRVATASQIEKVKAESNRKIQGTPHSPTSRAICDGFIMSNGCALAYCAWENADGTLDQNSIVWTVQCP